MTDRRCPWMRVILLPLAFAAAMASMGGLCWWSGTVLTTKPIQQTTSCLFVLTWVTYLFGLTVVETPVEEAPPDPEPRQSNVTIYDPPDAPRQFRQTHASPTFNQWRVAPALPAGITARELRKWLLDARDGTATFAANDSNRGEGGRSRGFHDDVTAAVKSWLKQWGVIDVDGGGGWQWGEMAEPLFDALLRGEGFDVLMGEQESE